MTPFNLQPPADYDRRDMHSPAPTPGASPAAVGAAPRGTPSRWTRAQAYVRRHRLPLHRDVANLWSDLRIALTPRDPAWGGTAGVVVVTLVAAFVGALVACGGSF